ncbi:MAG TPA: CpXC domain-containing protein [Kofleriaceae bacterium]|nr:CpXC domain-containing protein [Kofleriaceae bacterium]
MVIRGSARVTCPACGAKHDGELVQSINTQTNPKDKERLLAGELNVLACKCGKRTQLAANVLFHDPDAHYYCQVVPGGDQAMDQAAAAFAASGVSGTLRLVPSLNALVEKVKLLDAGLVDWAIEMTKVLLLASIGELDRVLLFEAIDREAGVLRWVIFDEEGRAPERVSSPLAAYEKLVTRTASKPADSELRIDRAWAVEAVKKMVAEAN